jgi:hypothetical protein
MRLGSLHPERLSLPVNFFQAVTDELYQFTGRNTRKSPGDAGRSDSKDFSDPPPRHRVKKSSKTHRFQGFLSFWSRG